MSQNRGFPTLSPALDPAPDRNSPTIDKVLDQVRQYSSTQEQTDSNTLPMRPLTKANSISEIDWLSIARESDGMTADSIDISGLSNGQRVALMERLWRSLVADFDRQGPPEWHDAELESRKGEWIERESVGEEWSVVREELRRDLR